MGIASEWISICLRWFPYTRPWGNSLQENLWKVLGKIVVAVMAALPDPRVAVVILAIARGMIGMLRGFFRGIETGEVDLEWMDVEAARATRRVLTLLIWLFAIVMIYPYLPGSGSNAFKGISFFVGVLSLGSSNVVGQFASGWVLMCSRALKPGEYVRIGEHQVSEPRAPGVSRRAAFSTNMFASGRAGLYFAPRWPTWRNWQTR